MARHPAGRRAHRPPTPPVVLVTGCSTGIGREAALHLHRAGATVVATARDVRSLAGLDGEAAAGAQWGRSGAGRTGTRDGGTGPGLDTLRLDVTSAADRARAIRHVLQRHGRIDGLVNNAGYGATLAVEDTSVEALRALFDVNLFGLHDLARRALPAMRAQGHGRIVNVASVAAHVPVPLLGAYCASKFAVRALTQTLDMEVRRFGVRAVLVEPGPIRTSFGSRAMAEGAGAHADAAGPYGPAYAAWARLRGKGGRGAHPRTVARQVVRAALARRPRLHHYAPASARAAVLAKRLLPDAWTLGVLRAYFR